MADFHVTDHGTVVSIKAVTAAARKFCRRHLAVPSWSGSVIDFTADEAPARVVLEMVLAEGFEIELA